MTYQSAYNHPKYKRPQQPPLGVYALAWLLVCLGDIVKVSGCYLDRKSLHWVASYDKRCRQGGQFLNKIESGIKIAASFSAFLTVFLVIEFLQKGVLEWLR